MSTNFPTSLDALTNPTSGDTLNTTGVVHSVQHGNANDAIEALEVKVGANSSTDTTSLTYKVATLEGATSGYALKADTLAQFAATTSLQLKGVISDETGSGALVFADTPTLVTPVLGVATATSINKVAITAPATSATLTIANGKTLTVNETLTLTAGASGQTFTLPAASDTLAGLATAQTFTANQRIDANVGLYTAPATSSPLTIIKTFTETSGSVFGANIGTFGNPGASSSATYYGMQITARTTSGNAQTLTGALVGAYYNTVHQGTTTLPLAKALQALIVGNNTGAITDANGIRVLAAQLSGGAAITNLYGLYIENQSAGGTLNYAIYTNNGLVHLGDDVDIASGHNLTISAASIITDTTTGLKIGTATTQKLGFFNATPIVRGTAFTQTYSTAATTITQTTMTDPAAYGAGANGYSTAAMAQAIHAEVIALKANMVVTQNVLNGVIDQLQALGLFG